MNLQKIYDSIIKNALQRKKPNSYMERHHIIPKSLGGSNDKNNLVELTAREHCLVHLLLAKIHKGKMWNAALIMTNRFKLNSRAYEIVRIEYSKEMSKRMIGIKNFYFNKGHLLSGSKNPNFKGTIVATNITTGICQFFTTKADLNKAGFDQGTVSKCLSGIRKTHKNHTFTRMNINVKKKPATPVPAGHYSKSKEHTKHGTVPAAGTREDGYDLDHYQRTISGEDSDYRTQTRGGDSVAHRNRKVEPSREFKIREDDGDSVPEVGGTEFTGGRVFD